VCGRLNKVEQAGDSAITIALSMPVAHPDKALTGLDLQENDGLRYERQRGQRSRAHACRHGTRTKNVGCMLMFALLVAPLIAAVAAVIMLAGPHVEPLKPLLGLADGLFYGALDLFKCWSMGGRRPERAGV
jgi:hypothetical protein